MTGGKDGFPTINEVQKKICGLVVKHVKTRKKKQDGRPMDERFLAGFHRKAAENHLPGL